MKRYNIGIVGYGWVATAHIPAINATPLGKCTSSIDCLQPYYFHTHLVGSKGSLLDNKFYAAGRSAELGRPVKMTEVRGYAK